MICFGLIVWRQSWRVFTSQNCMNWICRVIQTILEWFVKVICIFQYDKRLMWSLFAIMYFLEHLKRTGEISYKLSLWLEMKIRIVKKELWAVFKASIKEFCPRVPKDVIYWSIVVSWIVIFVLNVQYVHVTFLVWRVFIYVSRNFILFSCIFIFVIIHGKTMIIQSRPHCCVYQVTKMEKKIWNE